MTKDRKRIRARNAQATLRDVAAHAGVHFSTVSRAINPATRKLVKREVADSILRIARELDYVPNPSAVSLKTSKSFLINVLLSDLGDPHASLIVKGVRQRLSNTHYVAIIGDAERPIGQERHALKSMKMRPIGGLILANAKLKDVFVDAAVKEGLPMVQTLRVTAKRQSSTVTIDNVRAMLRAVELLRSLGHSRIAHVTQPVTLSTGKSIMDGFRQAAQEMGVPVSDKTIAVAHDCTIEAGRLAMERLLSGKKGAITAVVAAHDLLALGCIDALAARGIACPAEVSVVGFGDMPFLDRMQPALTTLGADYHHVGWLSADLLVKDIEHPEATFEHIMVQPALVIRKSTAAAP